MSSVELAVKKVKKLSPRQARELLGWLDKRQQNGSPAKRPSPNFLVGRKGTVRQRRKRFKAWHD